MKNWSKVLTIVICAICLVTASVMGTIAVLTAQTSTVTNTFTVGNITISLDESQVNEMGEPIDQKGDIIEFDQDGNPSGQAPRVTSNTYKLFEDTTYIKDPVVHVAEGSEACYLFVKVENQIAAIEADGDGFSTIEEQIIANGWTKYNGVDGLYWMTHGSEDAGDYPVFEQFTIGTNIENFMSYKGKTIKIKAYAVQMANLENVETAWSFVEESDW